MARKVGVNTIAVTNRIDPLLAAMPGIFKATARAGAWAAYDAAIEVYDAERRWPPNKPGTIEQKGHSKVMLDSGILRHGLRVDPWELGPTKASYTLGWDDRPRPDSDLNLAELAEVMEGIRPQPPNWNKKDPPYPWLSQVAYGKGRIKVRVAMRTAFFSSVQAAVGMSKGRGPSRPGGSSSRPPPPPTSPTSSTPSPPPPPSAMFNSAPGFRPLGRSFYREVARSMQRNARRGGRG